MRIATVVLPLSATLVAAGVTALALEHRPPAAARDALPELVVAPMPIALPAPGPRTPAPYEAPVGGQYLANDLLLAQGDAPPLVFLLPADELTGYRYGWRMPRLAEAMAQELAAVLDDCPTKQCSRTEEARAALRVLLDADDHRDGPVRSRQWEHADDVTEHIRQLTTRRTAGAVALDVTCTCSSWTVGMRMWNDITTCDATLRERGRVLASYRPRRLTKPTKESTFDPIDAWDQRVSFGSGDDLVIETGWSYAGDNVSSPLVKTTVRGGPRWAPQITKL
jgi:hypothetical protein